MLRIPKWLNWPKCYLLNIQSRFDLYTTSFVCVLVSVFSFQIDCMNFMYVACWKWTLYKIKMKLNQMLGWNLLIMFKNWLYFQCVVVPVDMRSGLSNLIKWAKIDECLQAQKQHKRLWECRTRHCFWHWRWTKSELIWTWKILIIQQIQTRSPESLISVISEGDRDKRFEDIDDDSCFDDNNDGNCNHV